MKHFALAAAAALLPAAASAITIDDFVTPESVIAEGIAPETVSTQSAAATAIGGERDLSVTKLSGADGERVRVRVNPNTAELIRLNTDDASGVATVVWDGFDGSSDIDYDGLGGLDFSQEDFLQIVVNFSDQSGPVTFKFYDASDLTGGTYASTIFTTPAPVSSGSAVLLSNSFATDFTVTGAATLTSILANVGAIEMIIDGENNEGWDMGFALIETVQVSDVPLPAALPMAALGFAGLGLVARRRG